MTTDWNPLLRDQFDETYWSELMAFVNKERSEHVVYPPHEEVFAALHLTSFTDTRVIILGQDPYHGPKQAHGLCFSVRHGVPIPPSLRNIHQELHDDIGIDIPEHGSLEKWAANGVLLLNTTLTVRAHAAASHQGHGWERFTDRIIEVVNEKSSTIVFILWGAAARKKKSMIDTGRHTVIESAHPSPLSARNGFFGSRPFSKANEALARNGLPSVDWSL